MTASPPRLALLGNPLSGSNRREGNPATKLASHVGLPVREASAPGDLKTALRELAETGPDILVINGGDGTIRMVVDTLRKERIFEREPILALLHGGSTNMTQKDTGLRGRPEDALRRLLIATRGGIPEHCLCERHPLAIRPEGESEARVEHGFFWSAGALPRVFRSTQVNYAGGAPHGPVGETAALLRALKTLFFGDPKTNDLLFPETIGWDRSDTALETASDAPERMFVYITTLDRLILGFSPGVASPGLKLVALRYPYARRNLVRFLLSRGRVSASPEKGFEVATAEGFRVRVASDWALDGEFFAGNPATPLLHVHRAAPFRFFTG